MSTRLTSAAPSVVIVSFSSARPTARAKATGVAALLTPRKRSNASTMRDGLRLRRGIVERDDEVAFGRRPEAPLDDRPWLQVVGKRDGAEIVAERRAEPRRRRLHRRDAGDDRDVERPPSRLLLDRLEHSRGHGEHARIAAGDDGDRAPLGGERQRKPGARELGAIVARVRALAGLEREPFDVRPVADDVGRGRDRGAGFGRHPLGRAGAEPDDGEAPAHGRRPRPGTRIIEK